MPMSLPLNPILVQPHPQQQPPSLSFHETNSVDPMSSSVSLAMSRSCDCLTQTDISAVLTPRNEQMPPDPPAATFLQFKKVDISFETSDSEATSSANKPQNLTESAGHQSRLLQHQAESASGGRSRSKSPRPQTLPGLVKASDKSQINNSGTTSPKVHFLTIPMHSGLFSKYSFHPETFRVTCVA